MHIVPFISQLPLAQQIDWCAALNQKLNQKSNLIKVEIASEVSITEAQQCTCAIVANPNANQLAHFPKLEWVQSLWAGVDSLVNYLERPTFKIVRLVDPMLAQIMAEAVLTWSLYLHRQIPLYHQQQAEKLWLQHECCTMRERTVAVLGLGELGRQSAELLTRSGFNVVGWSRTLKRVDNVDCYAGEAGFSEVLRLSDIVVILLPLTRATKYLFAQAAFSKMKNESALINFARGQLVNRNDLIAALDSGHLSHAVLDVFEQEPLSTSSELWHHPKITITPHVSAPTNKKTACEIVSQNIARFFETGELPETVNISLGY